MAEQTTQAMQSRNVGNVERGASIIAGSLLIYSGFKRGSWSGAGLAITGVALIGRGVTGHCAAYDAIGANTASPESDHVSVPYRSGIRVDKSVTVNKPRFEVYQFWRNLENLPSFMQHLERVRPITHTVSHWAAKSPFGGVVEWDAEIINDIPGELIAWRSLPGADVENAGSVHFRDAAANRGTEVKVELNFVPPGGVLGSMVAKLFGEDPSQQVEGDMRRFKMMLETGEIPTALREKRKEEASKGEQKKEEADVHAASEDSFPASDAPAWR